MTIKLANQENLDGPAQVFPASGAGGRVGKDALAMAQQARGNHPRVVQDHQLVAAKQSRHLREQAVGKFADGTVQSQKAGAIASWQRALRDLRGWQGVIEFVEAHDADSLAKGCH
jgi:hypothetical protein